MSDVMRIPSQYEPLVALSVLSLDLDPPSVGGWTHYLAELGIAIVSDDLGRDCIARADAARLFSAPPPAVG